MQKEDRDLASLNYSTYMLTLNAEVTFAVALVFVIMISSKDKFISFLWALEVCLIFDCVVKAIYFRKAKQRLPVQNPTRKQKLKLAIEVISMLKNFILIIFIVDLIQTRHID
jgi:Na+/melibiose symporter-like transporter